MENKTDAQNYYGSLCAEMYEKLHQEAPENELAFYLSYAEPGMRVLEPLCGSGRFLVPFEQRGFDITGVDLSREMLDKLKEKSPDAKVFLADATQCPDAGPFDYIFIPSGSMSLFTDEETCREMLLAMRAMLAPQGVFVFSVDTVNSIRRTDEPVIDAQVDMGPGKTLVLKSTYSFDDEAKVQMAPGLYELWEKETLIRSETMDFRIRLYEMGEMERLLAEAGFSSVRAYSSFEKTEALDNSCECFIYECRI
ncbi:MAG: class I SAM-dependent methyltransferase [Slackia sp.]|nr:class I SAM-dependent methyltransferase [Slackia sp.]